MSTRDDVQLRKVAEELRHDFLTLATSLDDYYDKCNKVKALGSFAAVAGGSVFLVAGVAATMTTFGLSAIPIASGATAVATTGGLASGATAVATTGGLASGGASLVSFVLEEVNLNRTEAKWKSFKMYFNVGEIPSQTETVSGAPSDIQKNSGVTMCVLDFLKFLKIFFDKEKLTEFIYEYPLYCQGFELLGIRKGETAPEIVQRILLKLEISPNQAEEIRSAIENVLNLKELAGLKSALKEDLLRWIARTVAEKCTLTPEKLIKIFIRINNSIPNELKKEILLSVNEVMAGVGTIIRQEAWVGRSTVTTAPAASSWLQTGFNACRTTAGDLTRRGADAARSATPFLPSSLVNAGSAASSVTKTVAGKAMARGADAYGALKPLASGAMQRGAALGQAVLPSSVFSRSAGLYASSRSAAAGLWARSCGVASRVKAAASGMTGAAGAEAGRAGSAVTSFGRPMMVLTTVLLPLSVYDLITVSVELRNKKKSRTGDFLRDLADLLILMIESENFE